MPVLLPNVTITTSRYVSSGSPPSSALTAWLSGIIGHVAPIQAKDLVVLPDGGANLLYRLTVETATDIQVGDLVTSMILLSDNISPYPGATNQNTAFLVRFVLNRTLIPSRLVYLEQMIVGGPAIT